MPVFTCQKLFYNFIAGFAESGVTMRIKQTLEGGVKIWLSANDTYNWAHRPGNTWPCSQLSGHRVFAEYEQGGDLVDMAIDGKIKDCDSNEFNAIMLDHLQKAAIEPPIVINI